MSDTFENMDHMFFQMVLSLQAGAMQQMGKIASPLTGKVERDLYSAKVSIDMLGMFQAKMKGNLTEEESKLLEHVLYELRLNYVDESKKPDDVTDTSDSGGSESTPEKTEESVSEEANDGKTEG